MALTCPQKLPRVGEYPARNATPLRECGASQLNPIGAGRLLVRVRILLRMAWDQFEKEGRPS
jgi:hypothetical protein